MYRGIRVPQSSGTCSYAQGVPISCQPHPIPNIWDMGSSRHSVHCLSTTSRLFNPGGFYARFENNNKHLLDSKNSMSCAPWHNLPTIL